MNTKHFLTVIACSLLMTNCAKKEAQDDSFNEVDSSLESTLNTLNSASEDMGDSNSGMSAMSVDEKVTAQTSSSFCSRAATQACQPSGAQGLKTIAYSGCVIPFTVITAAGNVALDYNTNTCSLSNAGDSVTRSYDVTLTGYYGAQLRISSELHQNYEGATWGGGGQALKTAGGWEITLFGQHRVYTGPKGTIFGNVSIRTTTPVQVTGTLSKENRTVNSGTVEVAHNLAKVTATYTPNNLHWDLSCCYPISGSLDVVLAGSINKSATVQITSCGHANVTYSDGTTESKTFRYCE